MDDGPVFRLVERPVHLGLGATAVPQPPFTGAMDWYEEYAERTADSGAEGRLVTIHSFDAPWTSWEVHPHGAELVVCLSGTITLVQDDGEVVRTVELEGGQAVVNPPGVWHTADVTGRASALFVTAGLGTEHRPR